MSNHIITLTSTTLPTAGFSSWDSCGKVESPNPKAHLAHYASLQTTMKSSTD